MITITIDEQSGFCFGVVKAINRAENELKQENDLYCLGDIVHNGKELHRLEKKGLKTIDHEEFKRLKNVSVLLRAHGEPPLTYEIAKKNNITIIDASCPVVLALQNKIKKKYQEHTDAQIVIYGKNGHAEVNGLVGQTNGSAIVIESINDLEKIDFNKDIFLYSQTTMSLSKFNEIISEINKRIISEIEFKYNDTICRQVANRIPHMREFSKKHDIIFFVSDKKSSNGKALYEECLKENANTYFISEKEDLNHILIASNTKSIGICGATSTPRWLMEDIEKELRNRIKE